MLLAFLLFMTTVFIIIMFLFSNQTGLDSVNRSGKLIDRFIDLLNMRETLKEYPAIFVNRNYIFRKLIHFTEYMILGVFIFSVCRLINMSKRRLFYITVLICSAISVLDETRQAFVPGRTPLATDVLIDVAGSVSGLFICLLLTGLFTLFKPQKV